MIELHNKVSNLKLKKALLLAEIESLNEVEESLFIKLGKVVAETSKIQKQILRATDNPIG